METVVVDRMNDALASACEARLALERKRRSERARDDEIRCLEYVLDGGPRAKEVYDLYSAGKASDAVEVAKKGGEGGMPLLLPRKVLLQALLKKKLSKAP